MRFLIIAFDCNPYLESESLVAFSMAEELSKTNEVIVLTRPKCQPDIEKWQKTQESSSLSFLYFDRPKYKRMTDVTKGTIRTALLGKYIDSWMNGIVPLIRQINVERPLDVIYRLTPNSYRRIPDLSEFKDSIKILGPVGGAQETPETLLKIVHGFHKIEEKMHALVNKHTLHSKKYQKRLNAFVLSSFLFFCDCLNKAV